MLARQEILGHLPLRKYIEQKMAEENSRRIGLVLDLHDC
jgi:hypothetical protein